MTINVIKTGKVLKDLESTCECACGCIFSYDGSDGHLNVDKCYVNCPECNRLNKMKEKI
jgi:hypothetical protein